MDVFGFVVHLRGGGKEGGEEERRGEKRKGGRSDACGRDWRHHDGESG